MGLDLVGLDAYAADLDLRINAPEDLDLAVRSVASQVNILVLFTRLAQQILATWRVGESELDSGKRRKRAS